MADKHSLMAIFSTSADRAFATVQLLFSAIRERRYLDGFCLFCTFPWRMESPLSPQQAGIFLCAQFFEHCVGQLPRITFDPDNQFHPDSLESLYRIVVVEANTGRQ
jgi:hypothetical protein